MKVGIITFHFVPNQGAVLQCLATQKFLESRGHEAWVINYCPFYHTVRYRDPKNPFVYTRWYFRKYSTKKPLRRIALTLRSFVRCIYYNLHHADAEVEKVFKAFTDANLKLTEEYKTLKKLQKDAPDLDAYVTGSDQLWNPELLDQELDPAYFLAFGGNIPKVAYAVSLGKNLDKKSLRDLGELSKNLTAVSLREYNSEAVESIKEDVHICLDPTLLLDAEAYAPYESSEKESEPYIFVYGFEDTPELQDALAAVRKNLNCKVINGSPHRIRLDKTVESIRVYGPDRFLTFVKDAECVVTNSFHGTAFSVIYKKRFVTVPHSTRGQRMTELLEKINLNQCLWGHSMFDFEQEINWCEVANKVQDLRESSVNYLISAIGGDL